MTQKQKISNGVNKKFIFLIIFSAFLLIPFISKAAVVINEIAWMGNIIDGSPNANAEWIELYNSGENTIPLDGWTLEAADGTPTILFSTKCVGAIIPANSFFLLERTTDNSVPGILADCIYTGTLGNDGEDLILKDADGAIVDQVNASNKWLNKGNNTTKQTMERIVTGWQTSANPGGTPKTQNSSGAVEESASTTENPTAPTIPTNSQPPIADAGENIIAFIDDEITFDGSKSYDPDGFDLAYEWNLGEGGVENDVAVTHKYYYPGTYLVTLMVFDGRYYVSDTITVEIYPKKITINEFFPSPTGKDEEEEWTVPQNNRGLD